MANIASFVEPKFLNGEMLGATPKILTIKSATIETLGDDQEQKVVVQFYEQEKPLPCNKTQLRSLIDLFGDETETYPNKKVMAYGEKLTAGQFAGKWTVKITAPPEAQPAPAPQAETEEAFTV